MHFYTFTIAEQGTLTYSQEQDETILKNQRIGKRHPYKSHYQDLAHLYTSKIRTTQLYISKYRDM